MLIDDFLSANAGFIENKRPRDLTALGLAGAASPGGAKQENGLEENPSLSIGPVPARLIKVRADLTAEESNTSEFFNRLIDGEFHGGPRR